MKVSECIKTARFPDADEFVDLASGIHSRIANSPYSALSNGNSPGQFLAWAFDGLCEHIGMLKVLPETTDRLKEAANLAYLVAAMLQAGVVPEKLPWEKVPWEWDGDDEALCRICEATGAGHDELCDGCRSAIIADRVVG